MNSPLRTHVMPMRCGTLPRFALGGPRLVRLPSKTLRDCGRSGAAARCQNQPGSGRYVRFGKPLTNHAFLRGSATFQPCCESCLQGIGARNAGKLAMPTIALVDDDRNILTSVSISLEAEGYHTMTYTDGASALDGFKTSPPDLTILDIKMPRMDGMETLRRLRQKSDTPVIFLTSKEEEIDEVFGLKMGADDFIRKPFSQRLLVERVKMILRRSTPKDGSVPKEADAAKVLERGMLRMDPERHSCTWKNESVTLTVTEFLILQALASRPGVVKSRNALMDAAYDDQVYVDDRTIDSHVKRLRRKFKEKDDKFDMIETLYGVGYRFKEM